MTNIRPANACDIRLLPEIERSSGEIFRQWPGLEWIADDEVQSEERHSAMITGGLALVAEVQGFGIAAFVNGQVTPDAFHIWQMAVHRDRQGHGIGRKLIEAVQRSAVDLGINALTLTTFREVPWNEPYYQRLGFITLDSKELCPRLRAILVAEGQAGLPMALRCAMRKPL
ncbi:GNAT family N-acetyltransferase [Paracoccus alkanivorans]|uniref:GNAT family N-acetyltransferase n=1 Tax=Paracoccus alkanivorans TaxID=2116655 RepID=A0A3M0M1L4_9RHOB|nr:GNAT family N-acetyltransferase [Paracoccus alkanivorans]RMC31315.1 GNAT family N-acetyltransferase [Paracoccus alkanivorans]